MDLHTRLHHPVHWCWLDELCHKVGKRIFWLFTLLEPFFTSFFYPSRALAPSMQLSHVWAPTTQCRSQEMGNMLKTELGMSTTNETATYQADPFFFLCFGPCRSIWKNNYRSSWQILPIFMFIWVCSELTLLWVKCIFLLETFYYLKVGTDIIDTLLPA